MTIDAWSRVIFQLKNLQEVFVDTMLQTVSSYKARVLTVLLNRGVKECIWPLKWTVAKSISIVAA